MSNINRLDNITESFVIFKRKSVEALEIKESYSLEVKVGDKTIKIERDSLEDIVNAMIELIDRVNS